MLFVSHYHSPASSEIIILRRLLPLLLILMLNLEMLLRVTSYLGYVDAPLQRHHRSFLAPCEGFADCLALLGIFGVEGQCQTASIRLGSVAEETVVHCLGLGAPDRRFRRGCGR